MSAASHFVHNAARLLTLGPLLLAVDARGESQLRLPCPASSELLHATTYDVSGSAVGSAYVSLTPEADRRLRLRLETRGGAGALTRAEALMAIEDDGRALRLLSEQSQSFDIDGNPLVHLVVDHERGEASCTPPNGQPASRLQLPVDERVANVPLDLLLLPLARGQADQVDFQLFMCRGGARLMNFRARRVDSGAQRFVEIRLEPVLGRVVGWLARHLTPKLSFWYELAGEARYAAHRLPLYSKGPIVVVVRDGISAAALQAFR